MSDPGESLPEEVPDGTPGPASGGRTPAHVIWIILAASTLTVMAGAVLGPVVNDIQQGLGVTQSLAGLIVTTHGIFIVLASPLAGRLVDTFGPRRPVIAGLLLYGVSGGAGLVIDRFPVLLASRAALGVAVAFVYTGLTVLIYRLYTADRKDKAMGLRASANSLGATVWPLVGGALGTLSWNAPFGVYLVALPLGLLTIMMVPEPAMAPRTEAGSESALSVLRSVLVRQPVIILVYLLYFVANLLLYVNVVFYPRILAGIGVDSSMRISFYLAAMGLAGGTSGYLYDRVRARLSFAWISAVALVLWTVAFAGATVVATPPVDSTVLAYLPVVAFGLGQGLAFPTVMLWIEELVPTDRTGQFSSYIAMFGYVGQFVSPIVFGALAGLFGITWALLLTAGAMGVAGTVVAGRRVLTEWSR